MRERERERELRGRGGTTQSERQTDTKRRGGVVPIRVRDRHKGVVSIIVGDRQTERGGEGW